MHRLRVPTDRGELRGEGGQAVAEFAIAAIPLLLMLLGVLQFALVYNAQIGLTNGVRDTARYGSTLVANDDSSAATSAARTRSFLGDAIANYVVPYEPAFLAGSVCFRQAQDAGLPAEVRVQVAATYGHPLFVPLVNVIIDAADGSQDGRYSITSTIELRVDNPPDPALNVTAPQCQS